MSIKEPHHPFCSIKSCGTEGYKSLNEKFDSRGVVIISVIKLNISRELLGCKNLLFCYIHLSRCVCFTVNNHLLNWLTSIAHISSDEQECLWF